MNLLVTTCKISGNDVYFPKGVTMKISPLLPIDINGVFDHELLILSEQVCIESAQIAGGLNIHNIEAIQELLRVTNSYYSNRIEAQSTHPIDIEKAMRQDFSSNSSQKSLQKLSLAHIQTQRHIEKLSTQNEVYDRNFVREIHHYFYTQEGMESFLTITHEDHTLQIVPGKFRANDVQVGNHIAPPNEEIEMIFGYFEKMYRQYAHNTTKAMQLLCALSAHHRLTWIHPFLDGNGRVSRLYFDALLKSMNLHGYGLWNISRGLARNVSGYQKHLSHADMIRQGATDGNGDLSLRGLKYYLHFMLESALDQIRFMDESLKLSTLSARIERFVEFSQKGMYNIEPLPQNSEMLFNKLLLVGELARGEVEKTIGKSQRTASSLIKKLLEMDYLTTDSPRGDIRLKFNAFFASKLMPDLIPDKG